MRGSHLPVLGQHSMGKHSVGCDGSDSFLTGRVLLGLRLDLQREPKSELRHPRCLLPFDIPSPTSPWLLGAIAPLTCRRVSVWVHVPSSFQWARLFSGDRAPFQPELGGH